MVAIAHFVPVADKLSKSTGAKSKAAVQSRETGDKDDNCYNGLQSEMFNGAYVETGLYIDTCDFIVPC